MPLYGAVQQLEAATCLHTFAQNAKSTFWSTGAGEASGADGGELLAGADAAGAAARHQAGPGQGPAANQAQRPLLPGQYIFYKFCSSW